MDLSKPPVNVIDASLPAYRPTCACGWQGSRYSLRESAWSSAYRHQRTHADSTVPEPEATAHAGFTRGSRHPGPAAKCPVEFCRTSAPDLPTQPSERESTDA